jgi:hypothetical protein
VSELPWIHKKKLEMELERKRSGERVRRREGGYSEVGSEV